MSIGKTWQHTIYEGKLNIEIQLLQVLVQLLYLSPCLHLSCGALGRKSKQTRKTGSLYARYIQLEQLQPFKAKVSIDVGTASKCYFETIIKLPIFHSQSLWSDMQGQNIDGSFLQTIYWLLPHKIKKNSEIKTMSSSSKLLPVYIYTCLYELTYQKIIDSDCYLH